MTTSSEQILVTEPLIRYSTVRPLKKVDAAGSQRISAEFVGADSVRRPVAKPQLKLESPIKSRPPLSARGRAGQALVEEVVLGVLDTVCLYHTLRLWSLTS